MMLKVRGVKALYGKPIAELYVASPAIYGMTLQCYLSSWSNTGDIELFQSVCL